MALVGNKIDFAHRRAVSFKEAEDFARENEMLFMETSAKTGINVADIFLAVGRLSLKCLTSYIVLILPFFHYLAKKVFTEFRLTEQYRRQKTEHTITLDKSNGNKNPRYKCSSTRVCFKQ